MTDGPTSSDLTRIIQDALSRKLPLWARIKTWLTRIKSRTATMGGYWGGITMRDPRDPNK